MAAAVALALLPPPAADPAGSPSTPISSDYPPVSVSGLPASPAPTAVTASFSDADSSVSSPPTRRFCLRYPLCHYRLHGTSRLIGCCSFTLTGPPPSVISRPPPSLSPLSPLYSSALPPPCRAPFPIQTCFSPLPSYPHIYRPEGSCVRPRRPARLLPRAWPPILLIRTKMSAIGQAGVRHTGRLRAGPRHAGSALTGPLP